VQFVIALTDKDWFEQLSALQPDEVNFWQPGGKVGFEALQPGEPLLFKLHSPHNFIVGGGFFSHFTKLPVSFAWNAFGEKNGVTSLEEMRKRISHYKGVKNDSSEDFVIGCVTLQSPFFFHRQDWLPLKHWPHGVRSCKKYNDSDPESSKLWQEVTRSTADRSGSPIARNCGLLPISSAGTTSVCTWAEPPHPS
jgi:putative restriction endonuclease